MKRKIILTAGLILALIALGVLWYKMPVQLMSLNPDEVSEIYIFCGTNGKELHITKKEEIEHIIDNFNTIKLQKNGISMFLKGYQLNLTIYLKDGTAAPGMNDFIMNGPTIRKDPFFYKIAGGNLDYPYIEDLVDKKAQYPNWNSSPIAAEATEIAQPESPDAPTLPKADTWQEAYLQIIWNLPDYLADVYMSEGDRENSDLYDPKNNSVHLGIHDFDEDGTPELIAGDGLALAVFTYADGQAEKLADLYYPGVVWCVNGVQFRDHSISVTCAGSGGNDYVQFGYIDGEYKLGLYSELNYPCDVFINGKVSTLEEMNRIYPMPYEARVESELKWNRPLVYENGVWVLKSYFSDEKLILDSAFDFDLIKWE